MSIDRTRCLDKLRPAGASSGGWTEGPMAPCGDDEDEDILSLELPDLSSVGFSWPGGKAGVRCQVFLASPTTGCVWNRVLGHFLYLEQK